ncbi:14152_t:CDS:2, partial [Funneliformis mosseae]
ILDNKIPPKPKNKGEYLLCHIVWLKGSPQEIEVHLAFKCQKAKPSVRDIFLQLLAAKTINLDASEFLKDLDEFIGDLDIDLKEKSDNSKIVQKEIDED